jgi:hypothetical protein
VFGYFWVLEHDAQVIGPSVMDRFRSLDRTGQRAVMAGLAFAALAILLGGWMTTGVALQTGSIGGCYTSGMSGDLVTDDVAGVAIIEPSGRRIAVTWPTGWTGRTSGTEVEILDSNGDVYMRTGTRVYLMGGYWYVNDSFLTCGGRVES